MSSIKELVHDDFEKLKANKDTYFEEFYKNNYKLVYRICFSILKNSENSEDVTQVVFEKILKMKKNQLPQDHESSWLYTVSKNEALQLIRKTRNVEPDDAFESIQSDTNEIDNVVDDENYEKIIKKLNKKQEQIVSLKVISDFTFREIGQIMSMPTATVQWYYYSSMKYLKVVLSNFALFLITLVVGLREMWKSDGNKSNEVSKNVVMNKNHEQSYIHSDASISTESIEQDCTSKSEFYVCEGISETINSTVIDEPYFGIISVAGIFLTVAIIFTFLLIKYQRKEKSSRRKWQK